MHKRLESLKPLLKAGEYKKADEALKEYRKEFPDDWDGKLMAGIIAQLKGDEETFRRIHDEAQSVIDNHGKDTASIKASPLWRKYRTTWERVVTAAVVGIVVGGAVLASAVMISKAIRAGLNTKALYAGPEYYQKYNLNKGVFDNTIPAVRQLNRPPSSEN